MTDAAALAHLGRQLRDTGYGFVTITPASHARVNARPGAEWATTLRDVFGWSRAFRSGIVPPLIFHGMQQAGVLAEVPGGWRSLVRFSTLNGALFVHSAFPTSAQDAVFFGPDTYKFADAIERWLAQVRTVRRAADLFAGAGPGAIVVARRHPQAEVLAIDINPGALTACAANADLAECGLVRPVRSDLLADVPGHFDLIVAHPPYLVDRDARTYRHGGGRLGAALSLATVKAAVRRLEPGGALLLFTGVAIVNGHDPFREEVDATLTGENLVWNYREVDPDVFGEELDHRPYDAVDRIALVVLTVCRQ
jgi:methylase of polypeptide subunit release factors